jgi:hypothetical protein
MILLLLFVLQLQYLALLKLFDCQDYGYLETRGSHNLFLAI